MPLPWRRRMLRLIVRDRRFALLRNVRVGATEDRDRAVGDVDKPQPPRESISARVTNFWSSSNDLRKQQVRRLADRGKHGLAELWRRYGFVAIGTYATLYIATVSSLFGIFHFDVIEPELIVGDPKVAVEKIIQFIQKQEEHVPMIVKVEPYLEMLRDTPVATDLVLAWLTAKLTEPARMLITIGLTPRLARLAGRVPPRQEGTSKEEVEDR